MGPGLLHCAFCLLRAQPAAAVSAFHVLGRARLSPGLSGRLCGPAGAGAGFPGGCGSLSVRLSSPGWTLPLRLPLLLIHHASHGLSFPQPPPSPRYLDLFLMLLLFFLLILPPSIKYLTFPSVTGIVRALLVRVPWLPRRPARRLSGASGSPVPASPAARPAPQADCVQYDLAPARSPWHPAVASVTSPSPGAPHLGPASQRSLRRGRLGCWSCASCGSWSLAELKS